MKLADAQGKAVELFGHSGRAVEHDNMYCIGFNITPFFLITVAISEVSWEDVFEQAVRRKLESKS